MKTKLFLLLNLLVLFLPVTTFAASIGIIKNSSDVFKLFSTNDGSSTDIQTLNERLVNADVGYVVANIRSQTGVEWLNYNNDTHTVQIYGQLGGLLDSFAALNSESIITVGNISNDHSGKEVVVCKDKSTSPRVKIFSYSEDFGGTQILSFKPFGEGHARERGCSALAIGDVDGDGENELVAFKGTRHHHDIKVKIFDVHGVLITSFMISNSIYTWAIDEGSGRKNIYVQDINADGTDEIIFQGDSDHVYAYNEFGDQIYKFNSNEYNDKEIKKIDVADIDGDGVAEVLVQEKGKKVPILILNAVGEVETHYNLYPNATHNAARFMFLGDFSTEL